MSEKYACPSCGKIGMRVTSTYPMDKHGNRWRSRYADIAPPHGFDRIRRHRKCECGHTMTTTETHEDQSNLRPKSLEFARLFDSLPSLIRQPVMDMLRAISHQNSPSFVVVKDGLTISFKDHAEAVMAADQMPEGQPIKVNGVAHG